jgi:hypothetical protein
MVRGQAQKASMPTVTGVYYEISVYGALTARAASITDACDLLKIILEAKRMSLDVDVTIGKRILSDGAKAPSMGFIPPRRVPRPPLHLPG